MILLVGLSEDQIKQIPGNILGIRRTHNQFELAALYELADVVTSLSKSESMGMTPIEGMACGTPAIVYDNTAQPELVTAETGLVVETGNISEVRNAIIKVCQRGKNYYAAACRKRALDYFANEHNYGSYLELYNYLLKIENNGDKRNN